MPMQPSRSSLVGIAVIAGVLFIELPAAPGVDAQPFFRFRLAVTESMIGRTVNEGDAKLAMAAWADEVGKQSGFQVDVHVSKMQKLVREVHDHQVDGFTLNTLELLEVEHYASSSLVMDEANAAGGDEYLILANEDSGIRTLADLRHKTLTVLDNPRMCLAPMWLEILLAASKLGTPEEFFARPVEQSKLSRVVLPVYFRQADACLVTRHGFNTMCELNPQLGHKLRVLATSPKLITTFMAFHKDCSPSVTQRCETALASLHKTPAGQQALTLFESSRLVVADMSVLRVRSTSSGNISACVVPRPGDKRERQAAPDRVFNSPLVCGADLRRRRFHRAPAHPVCHAAIRVPESG